MNHRLFATLALVFFAALALGSGFAPPAAAQNFVYRPTNPAFGGSPLNYSWMLNSANAQKRFDTDDGFDRFARDPLADFQSSLQRQILSQLSRELVRERFGDQLDLTQEGRFDLGEFIIEIVPGLDGVNIRIFNTLTGDESTVTVPSF